MIGGTPSTEKTNSEKVIAAAIQTVVHGAIMYYLPQAYPQLLCASALSGLGLVPANPFGKAATMGAAAYATQTLVAPHMPLLNTVADEYGKLAYPAAALSVTAVSEGSKLLSAGAKSGLTWLFDKKSQEIPHPVNEMSESQLAEMMDDGNHFVEDAEEAPQAVVDEVAAIEVELRRSERLKGKPRVDYRRQMRMR